MGKSQYKKKTHAQRHNPVRVPDSHLGSGKAVGQADPAKEQQMLPILGKVRADLHQSNITPLLSQSSVYCSLLGQIAQVVGIC